MGEKGGKEGGVRFIKKGRGEGAAGGEKLLQPGHNSMLAWSLAVVVSQEIGKLPNFPPCKLVLAARACV